MVEKEKVISLRQSLIIYDGFLQHVICLYLLIYIMVFLCLLLNKNTLGVKKVRGQLEAALQTGATKNFDIS